MKSTLRDSHNKDLTETVTNIVDAYVLEMPEEEKAKRWDAYHKWLDDALKVKIEEFEKRQHEAS